MTKKPSDGQRHADKGTTSTPEECVTNTSNPSIRSPVTVEVHDSAVLTFALPEGVEDIADSFAYIDRALEYYLLARYAHLHRMHSAFMINSFWAVEYALLAVLRFRFQTKDELRGASDLHSLTKYWALVKEMVSAPELAPLLAAMEKFDNYIYRVQGHFKERYPTAGEAKLTYEEKRPAVKLGDEGNRRAKFDRVASLSLRDFDHFMNFMFHDVAPDKHDVSSHLLVRLAMFESRDLYLEQNEFSIVHPNKKYHGELVTADIQSAGRA